MARSFTLRNVVITGAFCAAYMMLSASSSTTQETPRELVFSNACRTCHTIKEGDNRLGPSLYKCAITRCRSCFPDLNASISLS